MEDFYNSNFHWKCKMGHIISKEVSVCSICLRKQKTKLISTDEDKKKIIKEGKFYGELWQPKLSPYLISKEERRAVRRKLKSQLQELKIKI